VILPYLEGLRFIELAKTYRLHCSKMTEVKPREEKSVERLLIQFETESQPAATSSLVIYKNGEEYSDDFIALTRDFYLKL
jgi:tRNA1Val (adenine37-N6)-methyltransferase